MTAGCSGTLEIGGETYPVKDVKIMMSDPDIEELDPDDSLDARPPAVE